MTKPKTSKKESARIKKITDDFRNEINAADEAEMRQLLVKTGRKFPVPGKPIALEKVRAKCLLAMGQFRKKYSEGFFATQAGRDEVAIEYLIYHLKQKNLEIFVKDDLAYRYKILGKIGRKYPALREQATLMQNKTVTEFAKYYPLASDSETDIHLFVNLLENSAMNAGVNLGDGTKFERGDFHKKARVVTRLGIRLNQPISKSLALEMFNGVIDEGFQAIGTPEAGREYDVITKTGRFEYLLWEPFPETAEQIKKMVAKIFPELTSEKPPRNGTANRKRELPTKARTPGIKIRRKKL